MHLFEEHDPDIVRLKQFMLPGLKLGGILITIFTLFYIIWGGLAPIDSAVIAHGTIIPSENLQQVQHLYGGTVSKINVKDGEMVKKGQILYELSETQTKAKLQIFNNQYWNRRISEVRINTEINELDEMILSQDIKEELEKNPDLNKMYLSEQNLFNSNKRAWTGQKDLFSQQITLSKEHLSGLAKQKNSLIEEQKLIHEEMSNVQTLYDKQLVQKPRLLSLKKAEVEVSAKISEIDSNVNKTNESINEIKIKIEQLSYNRKKELASELKEVEQQLASLKEELMSATDMENSTKITAPTDGIVTNMRYHTIGGVVPQGGTLLQIVPINDNLIVEAKLNTQDIDVISVGQPAKIMITAFKARFTPRISGKITYVAADKQVDERSGNSYYIVRAEIDFDEIKKIGKTLVPGMMAEVFIVTGEHTFLEYFLSPITNSLRKAFREK